MKQGYLSQYFKGVAAKVLSAVETDVVTSNQHEFNGVAPLKDIFGAETQRFETQFIYLNDVDDEPVVDTGFLTWYDARENHSTRTEYRMYFPTTAVSVCAAEGDNLFIGLRPDNTILVVVTEGGSTIGNQLKWLFGIGDDRTSGFSVHDDLENEQNRIAFSSRFILERLGIQVEENVDSYLEEMLHQFGGTFPKTKAFSEYARATLADVLPLDNPDAVLMSWMEREEVLFRTLEKHLISERLKNGFDGDVDAFLSFSLSVQNRRKSRVGQALENHVETLLIERHIKYDRTKVTENKSKPDFIFPGISEYHDLSFDVSFLTMLGVKSTCKDRWRQILSEAKRISHKHLLTLEAAISENQTAEMEDNHLQLVVPGSLQDTYTPKQRKWLMNVFSFIEHVQFRQRMSLQHARRASTGGSK